MKRSTTIEALVLALLLCGFGSTVHAQTAEQFSTWGDNAMTLGDRYGASLYYSEALAKQPGMMELQWKYAEACRLSHQYDEAALFYDKVQRKDHAHKHPMALRWLAEMQMSMGNYADAERTWPKVVRKERDKGSLVALRAANGLAGCALAQERMAYPDTVIIEHLPMPLNSYASEFASRVGPDSLVYFTSLRGKTGDDGAVRDTGTYHARIFTSRESDDAWSEPIPLEIAGAMARDQANSAWSIDGRWFYFSQDDGSGSFGIWSLDRNDPTALATLVMGGCGNSCTQPMVARMRGVETLFFTKVNAEGKNGMDIWHCAINGPEAGETSPVGEPINTVGNESCPYFDSASGTLYFSSDFLPGLGGFDNFKSVLGTAGFSQPENLGFPMNSPANDLYPTYDATQGIGWFTSNRINSFSEKGETCCNDLYRSRVPSMQGNTPGTIVSELPKEEQRITSLREKLPIRLYFHNDEPDPRSWDTLTTSDYATTYQAYKQRIPEYHHAWQGNPSGIGAIDSFFVMQVDHGFEQLNDFITLLKQALDEGQKIELQVRGFASPLAKSDYNRNLSLRRIQSLIGYLRKTDDGSLTPYLDGTAANGGSLRIVKLPYGKSRASATVSDRSDDLRHSVYSVGAALERRIEIEQVMDAQ